MYVSCMSNVGEALDRVRIGARVRALRIDQGLTARQLAEKTGCSRPHISNIESGRSRATEDQRRAIAAALGIQLEDLEVAS